MNEEELVKWLITQDSWKQFDFNRALQLWRAQPQAYKDKVIGIYQRSLQTQPLQQGSRQGMLQTGGGQYPSQWATIGYGHTQEGSPYQVLAPVLPSSNLYTPELTASIYQNLWGKDLITGEEFPLDEETKATLGLNFTTAYQQSMKASVYNQIAAQNMKLTPEMKKELDRQLQQLQPGSPFDLKNAFTQLTRQPYRQAKPGTLLPAFPKKKREWDDLINRAERIAKF